MRVEDVVDGKSLNAYLDGLSQDEQRKARLRVVFRPAARIFPIASRDLLKSSMKWPQEAIAISGFVKISISGLALKTSNPDIAADIVSLAIKRAGSALSTMGRSYDYDVANTAELAARALFQGADCAAKLGDPWEEIRADLRGASGAIWSDGIPSEIEKIWSSAKDAMMANPDDWSFWIAWYERVLHGRDWCADEVGAVLSKIKEKDFDHGPLHINPMFGEVLARYRAEDSSGKTALAKASLFDFVEVDRQMRAVAFPSDHAAFEDLKDRNAFLSAVKDLRTTLSDWAELARAELQGTNAPLTPVVAVEQLLDQLRDLERGEKTSLRDLVRKGSYVRQFSQEDKLGERLGGVLHGMFYDAVEDYSKLAHQHLGDILEVLEAVKVLELGSRDPKELLAILKRGVSVYAERPVEDLRPPEARSLLLFREFIGQLDEQLIAIGEAQSLEGKKLQEKRFAELYGTVSATFGTYIEKGSKAMNKGTKKFDDTVKWFKRWDTLEKIAEWWNTLP